MRLLSELIARSAQDGQQVITADDTADGTGGHLPSAPASTSLSANGRPHAGYGSAGGFAASETDPRDPRMTVEAAFSKFDVTDVPSSPLQGHAAPLAPLAPPTSSPVPGSGPSRQELAQQALQLLKARATGEPEQAQPEDGRAKTRLLGFNPAGALGDDVFAREAEDALHPSGPEFPVGWLVVIDGPGHGTSFTLTDGVSQIGRGADQKVRLDFGDTSVSRANHAAVAYDAEQNAFFIGHGGKANIVRLNGQPVLSTEPIQTGDEIRVGETTLRLVTFCDESFAWSAPEGGGA